jgi:photosystem II stability/assembly factor-like uncharacterized protein
MKTIIASIIFLLFSFSSFSQNIWQQSNGPFTGTFISQLTFNSSGHIFACSYGAGIFRSTDNGSSWAQINQGLPTVNLKVNVTMYCSTGDIYSTQII